MTMATSAYQGRIRTARAFDADAALDAGFVRDFVQNNLNHLADESAQVRVAYSSTSSGFEDTTTGLTGFNNPGDFALGDRWYQLTSFGQFPIRVRKSGAPYRMRIRINASNQFSSSTTKIRVVLCPRSLARDLVLAAEDFVWESESFTSTSAGWRAGASLGTNAWTTQVSLSSADVESWVSTTSTVVDVGSTDIVSTEQILVALNVWYSTENATTQELSSPVLRACYAAEYVGD